MKKLLIPILLISLILTSCQTDLKKAPLKAGDRTENVNNVIQ